MSIKNLALIVAAGDGTRMKKTLPKQYLSCSKKPVLLMVIEKFLENTNIDFVKVVISRNHLARYSKENGILALEKIILEVLIETKGLPPDVQYDVKGEIEYIVEQDKNIELVEKGFVYLIRNEDIYKIGITDNLLRRFNQLKPDEVLNVVRCSNFESLEKELHKKFKEFRIPQTEYFRLDKNQIEQVNDEMTKGADF